MPNPIKYNTSTESNALKLGDFWIGTGDVSKGPTSITGYWNGITPPAGGYTVYLNKASKGPSISLCSNDADLIDLTNRISGQNYTTVSECLSYFSGQPDKVCFNRDYEGIVTDGLVLNLDAGFTPSYPKSGNTWYDISGNGNNGTLVNGPTFSGGSLVFDGIDSSASIDGSGELNFGSNDTFTIEVWVNPVQNPESGNTAGILGKRNTLGIDYYFPENGNFIRAGFRNVENGQKSFNSPDVRIPNDEWTHAVFIYTPNSVDGMKLYINGKLNDTYSNVGISEFADPSKNWEMGTNAALGGTSRRMNNKIAAARMYNKALSSEEVLQNYNATKYPYVNLFRNGSFKLGNENFSSAIENTSITYNGAEYSIQLNNTRGNVFFSDDLIEVDPNKNYTYECANRTLIKGGPNGDLLSGGHIGFACYNKDGIFCDRRSVGGRVDTVLTRDLNPGDEYAYVSSSNNGINWQNPGNRFIFRHFILFPPNHPDYGEPYGFSRIGFGDYNIWYNEITDIGGGELRMRFADQNDNWTTFPDIGYSTPAGTPVSNGVAGGTYNYTFYPATASYGEWSTYTRSGITGYGLGNHNFRPGTKYIKFIHLQNYIIPVESTPYPTMLLGEVKFTEESYDVGSN